MLLATNQYACSHGVRQGNLVQNARAQAKNTRPGVDAGPLNVVRELAILGKLSSLARTDGVPKEPDALRGDRARGVRLIEWLSCWTRLDEHEGVKLRSA